MMSLPEGGGRSRHDPGRLARQPARQATTSLRAAWQLDEVAAPGRGRRRRPGWTCWPVPRPHTPSPTLRAVPTSWGRLGHFVSDAVLRRYSSSLEPSPGRGGLAAHPWTRCYVSLCQPGGSCPPAPSLPQQGFLRTVRRQATLELLASIPLASIPCGEPVGSCHPFLAPGAPGSGDSDSWALLPELACS